MLSDPVKAVVQIAIVLILSACRTPIEERKKDPYRGKQNSIPIEVCRKCGAIREYFFITNIRPNYLKQSSCSSETGCIWEKTSKRALEKEGIDVEKLREIGGIKIYP